MSLNSKAMFNGYNTDLGDPMKPNLYLDNLYTTWAHMHKDFIPSNIYAAYFRRKNITT